MKPPIKGMKVSPLGEEYMVGAFTDCVTHFIGNADVVAKYKEISGTDLNKFIGRSPLEMMIDKATGYENSVFSGFADFIAKEIWGEEKPNE